MGAPPVRFRAWGLRGSTPPQRAHGSPVSVAARGRLSPLSPLLALRWEWLKHLGEDQTATETSHMITQGLAVAQTFERDRGTERLPVSAAVWVVQGFAVRRRGEHQE